VWVDKRGVVMLGGMLEGLLTYGGWEWLKKKKKNLKRKWYRKVMSLWARRRRSSTMSNYCS
jgi:hypothetical protein